MDSDIDVPCCFVVPMSDTATAREGGMSAQRVTERFSTIICADNSVNARLGRGYSAELTLRKGRAQLCDALMDWAPASLLFYDNVSYARSQHLAMNDARIWHQYEWTCAYYLAAADPTESDSYEAIDKVIRGNYPNLSALQVRSLAVNLADRKTEIDPSIRETYTVLAETLYGTNPSWIKTRIALDGEPPHSPDVVRGDQRHRKLSP